MKLVEEMPKEGQFVAVWEDDEGKINCCLLRWDNGELERYHYDTGYWAETHTINEKYVVEKAYIIKESK